MIETRRRLVLLAWLGTLALCAWIAFFNTRIDTDLTGFLPASPDRAQQLLLDQLREGPASRMMLIGVEGGNVRNLADMNRAIAASLRADARIATVQNGEGDTSEAERDILLRYRYLLSSAIGAGHFDAGELKKSLQRVVDVLSSPAEVLQKPLIPMDPTGEVQHIAATWMQHSTVDSREGVWFSADGKRSLLIAQTRVSGMDAVQQQEIVGAVRQSFESAKKRLASTETGNLRLLMSGTPVFAAESRKLIEQDSWRLSLIATVLVLLVLSAAYRSGKLLFLAFVPVISGMIVGVAAVSLVFGGVHGITLAFGATLIGEAVDYPNYAFLHTARGEAVAKALRRIGPTLRLAVLTTVFSSMALLLSRFSGLSQLGLLSLVGVATAGLVTYFVLPVLARATVNSRKLEKLPFEFPTGSRRRLAILPLLLIAVAILALRHDTLWDDDLGNLSPLPQEVKRIDQQLRGQLGASDIRQVLMVGGDDIEQVLRNSELLEPDLRQLVRSGMVSGFDMAAHYLPSRKLQLQRQAVLPEASVLRADLQRALVGTPFKDDAFLPFLRDVEVARHQAPVLLDDLRGSTIALKVQSLLLNDTRGDYGLITLSGVSDAVRLRQAVAEFTVKGAVLVDLKDDTAHLINGYRDQALRLTGLGIVFIGILLLVSLRSVRASLRVLYPVLAGVIMCAAIIVTVGEKLTLFHLVAMLLVVGIGLNYALFLNRREQCLEDTRRNHLSLAVCSLTTFISFGTLMLSRIPVLHEIGQTVAIGSLLCLACACLMADRPESMRSIIVSPENLPRS